MENQIEQLEAQNIQGTGEAEIKLSAKDYEDLKHKADVSSQNFERLKKAEAALEEAKNNNNEGSATQKMQDELSSIKDRLAKQEVLDANPILKDKWKELEEFRNLADNQGLNLKTAAKAFLVENGLLEVRRPGLESKTGGDRQPINTGMTPEQVEELRNKDFRTYQRKLMAGEFDKVS